jgi:hypothetical protein
MKANRNSHRVPAGPACRLLALAALLGGVAGLAGCQMPPGWTWPPPAASQPAAKPRPAKPSVLMDPCAERLHDICGQLLLYWSAKRQLPESLPALRDIGGAGPLPLACPDSGKPYVYNRDGLPMPDTSRRVLVYDAVACHSGMRWSIVADPARPGRPMVARVLLVPNDPAIFAAPPAATPPPTPATKTGGKD